MEKTSFVLFGNHALIYSREKKKVETPPAYVVGDKIVVGKQFNIMPWVVIGGLIIGVVFYCYVSLLFIGR